MSSILNAEVVGTPRLDKVLKALDGQEFIDDILDESSAVLFNRMRERFLQQVDPDGIPWIPSKAAQRRAKNDEGGGTLFDSGNLFYSLQEFAEDANSRAIGTDVPYGKFHQLGTIVLPIRQFLGFGAPDVEYMQDVAISKIAEALS